MTGKQGCCLLEEFEKKDTPQGFWEIFHRYFLIFDEKGGFLDANDAFYKGFNCKPAHLKSQSLLEVLSGVNPAWKSLLPDKLEKLDHLIKLPWASDKTESIVIGFQLEKVQINEFTFVSLTPKLYQSENKKITCNCEIGSSDTKNEIVTQFFIRLKRTEHRLSYYLNHFPGIFFFQNPSLEFDYISPNFHEKLANAYRGLKTSFLSFLHEDDKESFLAQIKYSCNTRSTISFGYRLKDRSGNISYWLDTRTPLYSKKGELLGYNGIWIDNTRLAIAEKRIGQLSWHSHLSLITAGLVHDFSNVMTGIFSLSELYCSRLQPNDSLYAGLAEIKKSSQEARRLIRRLIELNREEPQRKTYQNLPELIQNQCDLLKVIFPKNALIKLNLPKETLPVYLDAVGFRQMFLNLALNAKDACNKDPQFTVSVKKIESGDTVFPLSSKRSFVAAKRGVEIRFQDNGEGIPQKNIERIFEPFFTTKDLSRGSGIGLYNVKVFIEANEGKIAVLSKLKRGTSFYTFLPLANVEENEHDPSVKKDHAPSMREALERPSVLIYASKAPDDLEITQLLRDKHCEVITFTKASKVKKYLKETQLLPNLILNVELGEDDRLDKLIQFCREHFPKIKLALYTIGRNPDAIDNQRKKAVDLFINEAQAPIQSQTHALYTLLLNR